MLLHAGIADGRMWAPQVEALRAAGHEPVAPDLPGFGEAPLIPPTVDYVKFAAARLGGPGAVVGCSFGGRVALELAAARQHLVRALVLVAPGLASADWSEETQAGFAEEESLVEAGDLVGAAAQQAAMWLAPDATDGVRELTAAMTLRSYEQQLPVDGQVRVSWPEPSAEARVAETEVPTLVVVGDRDPTTLPQAGQFIRDQVPGAELLTLAPAKHYGLIEHHAEFAEASAAFVAEHTEAPAEEAEAVRRQAV